MTMLSPVTATTLLLVSIITIGGEGRCSLLDHDPVDYDHCFPRHNARLAGTGHQVPLGASSNGNLKEVTGSQGDVGGRSR